MNIRIANFIGSHDHHQEKKKQLSLQIGLLSSALERAVPEQMFSDPNSAVKPEAVSAVKALQKAAQQGQRIYHLTPNNKATALPNIHHDPATLAEINAALAVGKEVITHTEAIEVPGWRGAGYIIMDPLTGEGSYKISGGGNGGFNPLSISFALMSLLIVTLVLEKDFVTAAFVFLSFKTLASNIEKLAADRTLSNKEFAYQANVAVAFAWTSVLSALRPKTTEPVDQLNGLATSIAISGFVNLFSMAYFGF